VNGVLLAMLLANMTETCSRPCFSHLQCGQTSVFSVADVNTDGISRVERKCLYELQAVKIQRIRSWL
jgi:hypothetical protein